MHQRRKFLGRQPTVAPRCCPRNNPCSTGPLSLCRQNLQYIVPGIRIAPQTHLQAPSSTPLGLVNFSTTTMSATQTRQVWHEGELALQRLMGSEENWQENAGFVRPALTASNQQFFEELPLLYLGSRDAKGRLWASATAGKVGFLRSPTPGKLVISPFQPNFADPLLLRPGALIGGLGLMHQNRRRNRMNGVVLSVDAAKKEVVLAVDQAYGNCPKYITVRDLQPHQPSFADPAAPRPTTRGEGVLGAAQAALVAACDCLYFATAAPPPQGKPGAELSSPRGVDVSHRGGPVGFVNVLEGGKRLWWPDYAGNNMFMSFGNLLLQPLAGLLFINYKTGDTLQITGKAFLSTDLSLPSTTGMGVTFEVDEWLCVEGALPLRAMGAEHRSPYGPPVPHKHPSATEDTTPGSGADLVAKATGPAPYFPLRCLSVTRETPDVTTYEFLVLTTDGGNPEPAALSADPRLTHTAGQHAILLFCSGELEKDRAKRDELQAGEGLTPEEQDLCSPLLDVANPVQRTWTISSLPPLPGVPSSRFTFTISVKTAGKVSSWMSRNMAPGGCARLVGFAGEFTPQNTLPDWTSGATPAAAVAGETIATPADSPAALTAATAAAVAGPVVAAVAKAVAAATIDTDTAAAHNTRDSPNSPASLAPSGDAAVTTRAAEKALQSVLLLAGGIGITPMLSLAAACAAQGRAVTLIYSVRHPEDAAFLGQLQRTILGRPGVEDGHSAVLVCLTGGAGKEADEAKYLAGAQVHHGRMTADVIARAVPDVTQRAVYLCGPGAFMLAAEAALAALHVPGRNVHTESFEY